eukprot:TRINITY_DN9206_c0_g1_i1.p2 TRINITY_DN9206_c0_g1~~TRINITY_DN9206_c0_g1_i1.p2  ORF type:complete len:602 (+),score=272.76 TRINITY_DN9206_c0_g1_i1:266-1807(+)
MDVTEIHRLAAVLHSNNPAEQQQAACTIRKLLSAEHNPPIDQVIATNPPAVPKLVEFLSRNDNPQLQLEAAWALTNIASGTSQHTRVVVEHGAVMQFIALLSSQDEAVCEQAAWALGNIAGDSTVLRDQVLAQGAMAPLLNVFRGKPNPGTLRNATWTLSNLLRGKPIPSMEAVEQAIPLLAQLITYNDKDVVTDALWALSYASDGPNDRIQAVVDQNVIPCLMDKLSKFDNYGTLAPTLRTVGNMLTGSDVQTQALVDAGVLQHLRVLLEKVNKRSVRKECCWALSNVAAGTPLQIQSIIELGFLPILAQLMRAAEVEVKKEAAWTLANLTEMGNEHQVDAALKANCATSILELLKEVKNTDPKLCLVLLESVENILKKGDTQAEKHSLPDNPYRGTMLEMGVLDELEALQNSHKAEIYEKAHDIMMHHFSDCVDDEGPGIPSQDSFGLYMGQEQQAQYAQMYPQGQIAGHPGQQQPGQQQPGFVPGFTAGMQAGGYSGQPGGGAGGAGFTF